MSETPDFDNMPFEKRIRWLETLAFRQGAREDLTTSADMDIPEVFWNDPRLSYIEDYIPCSPLPDEEPEQKAKNERLAFVRRFWLHRLDKRTTD